MTTSSVFPLAAATWLEVQRRQYGQPCAGNAVNHLFAYPFLTLAEIST